MFHFFEKKKQREEEDSLLLSYMEVRDVAQAGCIKDEITRQEFDALRRIPDGDPVSKGVEGEASFRFLPRTGFQGKYFISYTNHPETVLAFRDQDLGNYVLLFENSADAGKYMEKVMPYSPALKLRMNTYDVIRIEELKADGSLFITGKNGDTEAYKGDGELFRAALLIGLKESVYAPDAEEAGKKNLEGKEPEGIDNPDIGKRKRYVSPKLRRVMAAGTDQNLEEEECAPI